MHFWMKFSPEFFNKKSVQKLLCPKKLNQICTWPPQPAGGVPCRAGARGPVPALGTSTRAGGSKQESLSRGMISVGILKKFSQKNVVILTLILRLKS
jgi:hypothetical protein